MSLQGSSLNQVLYLPHDMNTLSKILIFICPELLPQDRNNIFPLALQLLFFNFLLRLP